jgi:hypothetical protein
MADSSSSRVDLFWRRHPRLLSWATVLLAVVATLVLLVNTDYKVILYEGF